MPGTVSINYNTPPETRWADLRKLLDAMDIEERRKILRSATSYRSGEDSCNSVYMGSMAHAQLRRALGDGYPGTMPYSELVSIVDEPTLARGLDAAIHTIEYMLANPRKKCPCCGQIVSSENG